MQSKTPPPDTFQIRCPKLGHQIHFSYCRKENFGLPCIRTLQCWHIHFQVEKYLRKELSEMEWDETFEKPAKHKMVSLMELIDAAQNRKKRENK